MENPFIFSQKCLICDEQQIVKNSAIKKIKNKKYYKCQNCKKMILIENVIEYYSINNIVIE